MKLQEATPKPQGRRSRIQLPPRRQLLTPSADRPFLKIGVALLVLVMVVGILLDARGCGKRAAGRPPDVKSELQAMLLDPHTRRYVDRSGLFSICPPPGWKVFSPSSSRPHNVIFAGPNGADIRIMVTRIKHNDMNLLRQEMQTMQDQCGIQLAIEETNFLGRAAFTRKTRLSNVKIFTLDFVQQQVAHHIECGISPELFDTYMPAIMEVLNTYQPLVKKEEQAQPRQEGPQTPHDHA